jgi:hypothetical protein
MARAAIAAVRYAQRPVAARLIFKGRSRRPLNGGMENGGKQNPKMGFKSPPST